MTNKQEGEVDPEILAITAVHAALKELQPDAQVRVLSYVAAKLNISDQLADIRLSRREEGTTPVARPVSAENAAEPTDSPADTIEGLSPVAKRWMARNSLSEKQLSSIFSLGVDEIDLVAKSVPGQNKTQRMRNVFLLKGVAGYLGTGAARFTHEQVKEACLHYDAFDAPNFATRVRALAGEVSGSKETGYTLTARGLANGTELIKEMTQL